MSEYRAPRGTQDIFGEEMTKWHKIEQIAHRLCKEYHIHEMRTPIFEHTEVFKRGNDASDVVNKEMYTFEDKGGRSITLRPEGTAGLVRSYVEHKLYAQGGGVQKFYYIGPNFRYERPQKGRMRIHHQFGVEFFSKPNPYVDVEAIMLAIKMLQEIGLEDFKLTINTLGDQESQDKYKQTLKAHFKDDLNTMCEDCQRRYNQNPLRILDCKVDQKHPSMLKVPKNQDCLTEESKVYFSNLIDILDKLDIDYEVNSKLVRGLDYYHHTVFEIISTDKKAGSQSTLAAGGRYNHLVEYFGGPEISAFGFGMGIERLLVYAEMAKLDFNIKDSVDVYAMPLAENNNTFVLKQALRLRDRGYSVEVDLDNRSMRAQFKQAQKLNAKLVMICGDDEEEAEQVSLKNQITEEQVLVSVDKMDQVVDEWIGENK